MTEPETSRARWMIAIDSRDVMGCLGGVLILIGAAAFHWALALIVLGGGLAALSWRLSR